jgi:RNA polymerase primary sigma factor
MHDSTDPLDAILSAPPCSPPEAEAKARRLRARNERVERDRGLVHRVARKYGRARLPLEDIVQLGYVGLIRAVEDWDPPRGVAFTTHATHHIRWAIAAGVARESHLVHVPASAWEQAEAFKAREAELGSWPGRPAGFDEVADSLGLTDRRREIVRAVRAAEHPGPADAGGMGRTSDDASDAGEDDPRLRRALRSLPERQRKLIAMRYGLDGGEARTQAEVGAIEGVSKQRVGQVEGQALGTLRALLGA